MSKVSFSKGNSADEIDFGLVEGRLYLSIDTGNLYLATSSTTKVLVKSHVHTNLDKLENIDTELSEKQDVITGAASTITSENLTADRALISNSSGKVTNSTITSTELGYLNNVTSNIQDQLNDKVNLYNDFTWIQPSYSSLHTTDLVKVLTIPANTDVVLNIVSTRYGYPESTTVWFSNRYTCSTYSSTLNELYFSGGFGSSGFIAVPSLGSSREPVRTFNIQVVHATCALSDIIIHNDTNKEYASYPNCKEIPIIYNKSDITVADFNPSKTVEFLIGRENWSTNHTEIDVDGKENLIGSYAENYGSLGDPYYLELQNTPTDTHSMYRLTFTEKISFSNGLIIGIPNSTTQGAIVSKLTITEDLYPGDIVTIITGVDNEDWTYSISRSLIKSSDNSVSIDYNEGSYDLKVKKTSTINSDSSYTEIPSAKAVWDQLQDKESGKTLIISNCLGSIYKGLHKLTGTVKTADLLPALDLENSTIENGTLYQVENTKVVYEVQGRGDIANSEFGSWVALGNTGNLNLLDKDKLTIPEDVSIIFLDIAFNALPKIGWIEPEDPVNHDFKNGKRISILGSFVFMEESSDYGTLHSYYAMFKMGGETFSTAYNSSILREQFDEIGKSRFFIYEEILIWNKKWYSNTVKFIPTTTNYYSSSPTFNENNNIPLSQAGAYSMYQELLSRISSSAGIIDTLEYSDTETAGTVVTSVNQNNGTISVTRRGPEAFNQDALDITDSTEVVTTSTEGTSQSGDGRFFFRRQFSKVWNYIKSKADGIYHPKATITTKSDTPTKNDIVVMQDAGSTDSVSFVRRKMSQLWDFFKTQVYSEAYLGWGGKNITDSFSPIDASLVGELGANRTMFLPADRITVEYSRDGGSTWIDYGLNDTEKQNLFVNFQGNVIIGKSSTASGNQPTSDCQVRITFKTQGAVYTELNKFIVYASTNGSSGSWISIDARLQTNVTNNIDTWTNFVPNTTRIGGWPGYNVCNTEKITTFGNNAASQYGEIRFTFGCTGANASYSGLTIYGINCYGGVGWSTPSQMASNGSLFSVDCNQVATFPNSIKFKKNSDSPVFIAFNGRDGSTSLQWQLRTDTNGRYFGLHDGNDWYLQCDTNDNNTVIPNSFEVSGNAKFNSNVQLNNQTSVITNGNKSAVSGGEVYDALQGISQNTLFLYGFSGENIGTTYIKVLSLQLKAPQGFFSDYESFSIIGAVYQTRTNSKLGSFNFSISAAYNGNVYNTGTWDNFQDPTTRILVYFNSGKIDVFLRTELVSVNIIGVVLAKNPEYITLYNDVISPTGTLKCTIGDNVTNVLAKYDASGNDIETTYATTTSVTDAINTLDVTDTSVQGKVVTEVSETDGKIAVTRKGYDAYDQATADVKDATEFITTDNGGPTSSAPLLYRRPATALWNYIKGKSDSSYVKKSGDTMTGLLNANGNICIKGTTSASNAYDSSNPKIEFDNKDSDQNVQLIYTDYDSVQRPSSLTLAGNQGGEYFIAPNIKATSKFYGDLDGLATKATGDKDGNDITTTYVKKVTSTDNAVTRFDGTSGSIQNSEVKILDDNCLITPKGQRANEEFFYGIDGQSGYVNFMQISTTTVHRNEPIVMRYTSRGNSGYIIVHMAGGGTAGDISSAKVYSYIDFGTNRVWYKISNNVLYLYYNKSEAYDNASITFLGLGAHQSKQLSITWSNTLQSSSSGLTQSTLTTIRTDMYMDEYSKASSASAITTSDTVKSAIGKLEKGLDLVQPEFSKIFASNGNNTTTNYVSVLRMKLNGENTANYRTINIIGNLSIANSGTHVGVFNISLRAKYDGTAYLTGSWYNFTDDNIGLIFYYYDHYIYLYMQTNTAYTTVNAISLYTLDSQYTEVLNQAGATPQGTLKFKIGCGVSNSNVRARFDIDNNEITTTYLKTANFESQLTSTARRYFTVFNNSTTSSAQYVKIFEAQLPNDGKERGGFIDSYMFEYSNSSSNVIKTCRISYIIGRNSGSNTIYGMITKSMSSYEDYILAYSATDSKYAIYAYLKAANRRNVFEVHQAYDEQNITYVQRPDPVASLPSGYTYRYAVPFNHVTQSLDLIGSNVAGVTYGKVCSYEFTNMTKSEARCVTLRINSRTVVHNVVVRAGSDGIELYDNVYGISSTDRGLYGYLETVDSSWYRVTIYMMMNNYREGASITDVSFPAFNIRYTTSHDIRYFTTYNNQYVTTLPTGYVTATVNAAAMYDSDYNVIKNTYMKKGDLLEITESNYSTYYNSSTLTLNLPANVNTVIFSNSTLLEIKNITGITENGRRISLLVSTNLGIKFRESNSGDYRLGRYIYNYIHNSANESIGRNIYEGFIDLILWNKVWYSKTY